ncbi:MAG: DUF1501 domain-containing protein [Bacteroidia bacterium]
MNRRDFLKHTSLVSASALLPAFLHKLRFHPLHTQDRKLVIVQLSGGNDWLNAFVPYRHDPYYRLRPQLGIAAGEVLPLTDEIGLNPALTPLRTLYDQGWMSLLNQVGYPNPDRSHFRAMDIWHSASGADAYWDTGWLGRYLDHCCTGSPHRVLEIDDTLSLAVKGEHTKALAVSNPQQLYNSTRDPWIQHLAAQAPTGSGDLDYLYKTLAETTASASYIYERAGLKPSGQTYPSTPLGRQLHLVATLMAAGVETQVFYVSMTGFDTHVRQRQAQDRLLKQYAGAMAAFVEDLRNQGLWGQTAVMTFSEFGRRVEQNASGGTDHGKAGNVLLMGGSLRQPGVFNAVPDLLTLDDGDLPHQLDFRQVYATLLHDWLGADDAAILGQPFAQLPLV